MGGGIRAVFWFVLVEFLLVIYGCDIGLWFLGCLLGMFSVDL